LNSDKDTRQVDVVIIWSTVRRNPFMMHLNIS